MFMVSPHSQVFQLSLIHIYKVTAIENIEGRDAAVRIIQDCIDEYNRVFGK